MTNSLSVSQSNSLDFLLQPHIHFPFLSAATQTVRNRMIRYRNRHSRHISSFCFLISFLIFSLSFSSPARRRLYAKSQQPRGFATQARAKTRRKIRKKIVVSYGDPLQGGQQKKPHATHSVRHRASWLFPILFILCFWFPAFPWVDGSDQRFCYFRDQGGWKLT